MNSGGYLVLRRGGALWGVARGAIVGVERRSDATAIATTGGTLLADEVLGLVDRLDVRPPAAVGRYLAAGVSGLGVHAGACVAIVDPGRPPEALQAAGREPAAAPERGAKPRRKGAARATRRK